jgi:hypothetical protein
VRPTLSLHGRPVDLALLEQPVLSIASVDGAGVAATLEVRDPRLEAGGELVHEIAVPEGLRQLRVSLRGRVRSLSEGREIELESTPVEIVLNGIDETDATACLLLGRAAAGWHLDLLGRNGEPKARRAVRLRLSHRDFSDAIEVELATDERGRIELGALQGIARLNAEGNFGGIGEWDLETQARTLPQRVHGPAGETLRVPWQGSARTLQRSAFGLFELRGGVFVRDAYEHLALADGFLELRGLAAGDYLLRLEEPDRDIEVRVAAGVESDGWVQGRARRLELGPRAPLAVRALSAGADEVVVQLAHAGPDARVHVVATRYRPAREPFRAFWAPAPPPVEAQTLVFEPSSYHAGRELSDEFRYVLERRLARKFPGNLLPRPGLLLNPWSIGETDAEADLAGRFGNRFGGKRSLKARGGSGSETAYKRGLDRTAGFFPDLDFLPRPARVLANLRPDDQGRVRVPRADLGDGQEVHVFAADTRETIHVSLALDERPLSPSDQRLARSLDPARHFAEQRRIEFVDAGGTLRIEDAGSSKAETYDSLAGVFRLFRALNPGAGLERFAFLLRWPGLTFEEKRVLYSEHACHELHLFLARKDPRFFETVVQPYLVHKAHKTFLDRWLLGLDLRSYLDPWAWGRLNTLERILLCERIEGEREAGARGLREHLQAHPLDPRRARELFEAALAGSALAAGESLGTKLLEVADAESGKHRGPSDAAPPGRGAGGPATPGPGGPGAPVGGAPSAATAAGNDKAFNDVLGTGSEEFFLGRGESEVLRDQMAQDRAARERVRALYRAPERTQAWIESDYWRVRPEDAGPQLVGPDPFWLDFAERDPAASFRSPHFAHAADTLTEMLLALAVLDLPFEAGAHQIEVAGRALGLRAASPLLVVRKDVLEAAALTDEPPLLMSQDVFRLDEPQRHDGAELRDAFLTGELEVDVAYGCRVVLTNPTSTPRRLEVLLQIPAGALPVRSGFRTRSFDVELEPYGTTKLEYAFYFPAPGEFEHFPAHAARDGAHVASVPAVRRTVVPVAPVLDLQSLEHVSQAAGDEQVLEWLARANLERVDLSRIAWRLRERDFFERLLAQLRARHVYDALAWSYALLHEDPLAAREYLRHQDAFLANCGMALESPLVTLDPLERGTWKRVEFEPLFHARAHAFGGRREILDRSLEAQYRALLELLACRRAPSDAERLDLVCLLLYQDRIEEALAQFARVDATRVATALQHDYLRAYLGFFVDGTALSRQLATVHRDHPVERWRARFRAVLALLDEAAGGGLPSTGGGAGAQGASDPAAAEPALELAVEPGRSRLAFRALESCELRYYPLDVEFRFSTSPFARADEGGASFVRPARSDVVALPADGSELVVDLPREFAGRNVLVEARAGGLVRRQTHVASSLDVRTLDAFGQLVVTSADTGRALPQVYVKVFARTADGGVRFHKDGYTDLRGRFDYASRTGAALEPAERYALLVLSERDGAVLREVAPPPQ